MAATPRSFEDAAYCACEPHLFVERLSTDSYQAYLMVIADTRLDVIPQDLGHYLRIGLAFREAKLSMLPAVILKGNEEVWQENIEFESGFRPRIHEPLRAHIVLDLRAWWHKKPDGLSESSFRGGAWRSNRRRGRYKCHASTIPHGRALVHSWGTEFAAKAKRS